MIGVTDNGERHDLSWRLPAIGVERVGSEVAG